MPQEKFHATGLALAAEQLQVEESLAVTIRLAEQQASEKDRHRRQEVVRTRLAGGWDDLPVRQRQEMLREILSQVIVADDMVELVFRS